MKENFPFNLKISGHYHSTPHDGIVSILSEPKLGKKGWSVKCDRIHLENMPKPKFEMKISKNQVDKIFGILNKNENPKFNIENETTEEIVNRIKKRFDIHDAITYGTIQGDVYFLIVTGSSGIGKSYSVIKKMEELGKVENIDFVVIKGHITAINLYRLMYEFKDTGKVIIIDDADSILFDENALNLLKSGLDSDKTRRISWMSNALKNEDIPKSFIYEGAMIFLSNINFQSIIDEGKNKISPHLNALMSKSLYLDLNLWSSKEIFAWIEHIVKNNNDFYPGVSRENKEIFLFFTKKNINKFRILSIREIKKLTGPYLSNPHDWKNSIEILSMKNKQFFYLNKVKNKLS